ncbi:MAG TPA: hypothetical protein VE640_08550 [Candidatus Bathyarchaeia archaeon]|nr:hypothetical protein [Candidatus Bathyarchaeia archaeon]
MTTNIKFALAAALVVAALAGGALAGGLVGGRQNVPIASPTASAQAVTNPGPSPCGVLVVGSSVGSVACVHSSAVFRPTILVDAVPDWRLVVEEPGFIQLNSTLPAGSDNLEGVGVWNVDGTTGLPCQVSHGLASPIPSVKPFQATSTGSGPTDYFAWIATNGIALPAPRSTSVAGRAGLESIVTCDGLTWRTIALDVGGTTVTMEAWAPPERYAAFAPIAGSLIANMSFD